MGLQKKISQFQTVVDDLKQVFELKHIRTFATLNGITCLPLLSPGCSWESGVSNGDSFHDPCSISSGTLRAIRGLVSS